MGTLKALWVKTAPKLVALFWLAMAALLSAIAAVLCYVILDFQSYGNGACMAGAPGVTYSAETPLKDTTVIISRTCGGE